MTNLIKCSSCDTPVTTIDHIISLCAHYFWVEATDWQYEKLREYVYGKFDTVTTPQELPKIQKSPETECTPTT